MTTATYTRSGNAVTVTSVAHGMTVGRWVYCKFTTGTATSGPLQVLAVPTADTFLVASPTSGTIASSAVVWGPCGNNADQLSVTTAAATSQANASTTITITPSGGHSFAVENIIFIKWAAGAAQTDGFFRVATVSTTVSFTVVGANNGTGSTRNSTCDYYNEGTYDRGSTTGSTSTVTTPNPHNLSSGQQIYCAFGSTSATAQTDGYFSVTVTSATTFTIPVSASSGARYGQLLWATNCATFSQAGTAITIYQPNHGFAIGRVLGLAFVGTNTPKDVLYTVTGIGTNDFDVVASTSLTTTGGVLIGTASMEAEFDFGTSGTVDAASTMLQQRGQFTLSTKGDVSGALTSLDQFSAFALNGLTARVDAGSVTQTQTSLFPLIVTGRVEVGRELNHEAGYSLAVDGVVAASAHPEDQDARFAPMITSGLKVTAAMLVVKTRDTFKQLLDDAARQCGYQTAAAMLPAYRDQLVDDANAAIQELFSRANYLDYFNRTTRTYTLTANTNSVSIETDVQTIHGHVRVTGSKQSIPPSRSQSEIELFSSSFLTAGDDTSVPHTYFALRHGDASSAYGYGLSLLFAPTPANNVALSVEVTLNAPRYSYADYLSETSLAIPHRYAASILYPVMRHRVASNRQFVNKEALPQIKASYQQARELLGYADPAPLSTKNKKPQELEPASAS